jgi:hypothetical protein
VAIVGEPISVLVAQFPLLDWPVRLVRFPWAPSLALFFGVFPNGRMVPRAFGVVIALFAGMFFVNEVLGIGDISNDPFWNAAAWVMWPTVLLGGVAAQVYRYLRVSTAEEKRQTRWVLFGLALFGLLFVAFLFTGAFIGAEELFPTSGANVARLSGLIISGVIFLIIPLAIGMAVLRSQLFDIDIIIRRTATYAVVSALLLAVFFGSVVSLQQLFAALTGSHQNELVTVLSTLGIAALFVPVRNRVQGVVDRRFNRRKYDAQQVLAQFAATVRDETDIEKLTRNLVEVVNETMQPRSVNIWLKK